MSTSRRSAVSALALLGLGGCYAGLLLGPVDPEDVTITLEVSGGIAGVSYAFEVDGEAGEVVALSCVSSCEFSAGDVLLAISEEQVEELARAVEEAGVLGLDGQDFGVECCDDFIYELGYRNGARSARVTGGGARLPPRLATVVARLHGLAHRSLPAIVSPDTRDTDWPRDAYTLGRVEVDGLRLSAEMSYGGGCGTHRIDLVLWGGFMESFPVQVNALLTHEADDPCDALLIREHVFDLAPLRDAYERAYGRIGDERPTVVLRLWDPVAAGPLGRLVEVRL